MSKRVFLVTSQWSWDHSNMEYATFTIEGIKENDSDKVPLTRDNLQDYLKVHGDTIRTCVKTITDAQDGSTMGKIRITGLYVVDNMSGFIQIEAENKRKFSLKCDVTFLCEVDKEGNPIV